MDLPDVAAVSALAEPDQAAVVEAAFLRTWLAVDGNTSPDGRRRWFAAWRAWADTYAAYNPGQEAARRFTLAALEYFETYITQQETAGRN
jgi:hypothetical protein